MKIYKILFLALLILPLSIFSQDEVKEEKPERPAFESSFLIDNPTNVLFSKNTLEVQMSHRFGEINHDKNDAAGFWGASNIRIGLTYGLHDRVTVGVGTTKNKRYQDLNWKVALLHQTRSDKMPISLSYYGNYGVDLREKNKGLFPRVQNRYSFFNQIIIARRFNPNLSLQIAPSISHFNAVPSTMKNDMISVAFGGRYKISPNTSILLDYSQPITKFEKNTPEAGFSFGLEFGTSAHTFSVFATNLWGILPQENYMFNDKSTNQLLIGFNITRNYNF